MYVPKKLKWDTLGAFKKFLETETTEKIISYNGYEIVTETTEYGIIDSQLNCRPVTKKKIVQEQEPKPKKPLSETNNTKLDKIVKTKTKAKAKPKKSKK